MKGEMRFSWYTLQGVKKKRWWVTEMWLLAIQHGKTPRIDRTVGDLYIKC